MNGRRILPWLGLIGALAAIAALIGPPADDGPPLDPTSNGPLGTRALTLLLGRLDATVVVTREPPSSAVDVALLLADDLSEARSLEVAAWVRAGGTLVVTDPGSRFAPQPSQDALATIAPSTFSRRTCDIAALVDLDRVDPVGGLRFSVPLGARSCFGDGAEAFVVAADTGDGTVVSVGGAAAFTNSALDEEDNAPLAGALLAPRPGNVVAILRPPAPGTGDRSLRDLIAPNVRRAILQLGVAFAFYALWRSIRLGKPVAERQPVQIAGSELVSAVGSLLQQSRSPERAAAILRADLRRSLSERLGIPREIPAGAFADAVAARTGASRDEILLATGDAAVTTDAELVGLARTIDAIRQEVLHAPPVRHP